jgi:molecular chaperone GrpE
MTHPHSADKNHADTPQTEGDAAADTPADAPLLSDDISLDAGGDDAHSDALADAHARIAELEAKLAEVTDKTLRALAEAENTRKRMEKERQDTAKFALSSFARELLSVADNLARALSAITPEQRAENEALKNIFIGVEATEREMLRLMENNGIKKIDSLGKVFDPNIHEVMFEADAPDKAPGTIIQVLDNGYMIHERLLRPARVGVAKGGTVNEGGHVDESV